MASRLFILASTQPSSTSAMFSPPLQPKRVSEVRGSANSSNCSVLYACLEVGGAVQVDVGIDRCVRVRLQRSSRRRHGLIAIFPDGKTTHQAP
eukprot:6653836-Lingulodinium_polyedra.AAC.1